MIRAPGGSRTHTSAIPRRQAATTSQGRSTSTTSQQSAQWESNPHVRLGKAIGYRYIMGAAFTKEIDPEHPAGVAPAYPLWKSGVLLLHHGRPSPSSTPHGSRTRLDGLRDHRPHPKSNGAYGTSGSGGNRTHVHLLKRQAPRQRRTHFHSARFRAAVPRGFEPPLFSLTGRRPLHWPAEP